MYKKIHKNNIFFSSGTRSEVLTKNFGFENEIKSIPLYAIFVFNVKKSMISIY